MYYLHSRYYDPEVCRFINADAFVSTGQGILGYNMFAYCSNNPVISKDSGGCIPTCCVMVADGGGGGIDPNPEYDYINGQQRSPYNDIIYGNSTIGYAGCEVLASYNTLISVGKPEQFDDVKSFFENRFNTVFFSGWCMGGHFGAMPRDVEAFLDSRGVAYVKLSLSQLLRCDYYGPVSGNYILIYWNGIPFVSSYHTIAVVCNGCEYTAYNWKTKMSIAYTKNSILEFLPDNLLGYLSIYRAYYIPPTKS